MNLFSSEDLFFSFSSHFPLLSDSFRASGAEGKEKTSMGVLSVKPPLLQKVFVRSPALKQGEGGGANFFLGNSSSLNK